jgi:peptide/nickel transport system permease protein
LVGTDMLGRDVLARLIDGIRPALVAGLVPPAVALVLGVPLGLCAGWLVRSGGVVGRVADVLISSVTDALLAFPLLVMALVLASFSRGGLITAVVALAIGATAMVARVTRSHVIAGAGGEARPSMAAILVVQAMLSVATAVIGFAAISALGYGEPPPAASWGNMIGVNAAMLARAPWVALSAGLAVVMVALAFNLIGIGLRRRIERRAALVQQAM